MPTFNTPTRPQSTGNPFWRRYTVNVGVSVVKSGGQYRELPGPTWDELIGQEGTDWFIGGHVYEVSAKTAAALAADGFESSISDDEYSGGDYGYDNYGDE